ncbi:MAG TPA: hypothetical protein VFV78_05295 [Vicinamibacterales bacterium]|nr:hypothetical protein [Vicinamibacterales bacterium]
MTVPAWLQECIDDVNQLSKELRTPDVINERARAYSFEAASWLQTAEGTGGADHADLRAILAHDCAVIPASVCRALSGWQHRAQTPGDPAKVARLCIERSRAAWTAAVRRGLAPAGEIGPFLSELDAIREDLDRLFPRS